jgi:Carboxypeptidase regulatory-like domain
MTSRRAGFLPAALLSALSLTACQKKQEGAPAGPAGPPAADVAGAGNAAHGDGGAAPVVKSGTAPITGTVRLTGKAPEMQMTKRQADPFCARTPTRDEEVIVGPNGGLKNVLVRIRQGITGNYEPPMTNATLDQSACMFRPRVQGILAGQSLLIRNSDQTLHNVHTYKGASTMFNQAEIPGLPPMAKKFNETDEILKFKCDVHPWMTAYVAILNHPFYAVTGDDGGFSIPKVPAGKYTLEAWHERYGKKTTELTVEAGTPSVVSFEFEAK